ncbi:unnamed protein product, partial [Meganyctiphanes norvegica]
MALLCHALRRFRAGADKRRFACTIREEHKAAAAPRSRPVPAVVQRRHMAMRLELTENGIVWRRPTYVPSWKPEKSGDLETNKEVDKSRPIRSIMCAQEALESVDEDTRRLLSLEFHSQREGNKVILDDVLKKIQRHQYDDGSMEAQIAKMTVKIRVWQKTVAQNKKDTEMRVKLQELIDKRKKTLKHLRRMDYKRFEWLIQRLGILYRPPPEYFRWITRKTSLRKLVRIHYHTTRKERLKEYREILEAKKEPFLREKAETQMWIAETEQKLGLPVSVEVP